MSLIKSDLKVTFVGLGKMMSCMLKPLLDRKVLSSSQVTGTQKPGQQFDVARQEFPHINIETDNVRAIENADLIFWGTKPQDFIDVAEPVKYANVIKEDATLVSIMAGVRTQQLIEGFNHKKIVRAMPNTPVSVGYGVTAWYPSRSVPTDGQNMLDVLFNTMGSSVKLEREIDIDRATAISGSGPAYFFLFQEALIEAGVHIGLSRSKAEDLAFNTMLGTSKMALLQNVEGQSPALLKYSVTSPGGITASALYQAEKAGIRTMVSDMVWAAFRRSLEIGDEKAHKKIYGPGVWTPIEPSSGDKEDDSA